MFSWSLGGYPAPNLEIAARFRVQPTPSVNEVLDAVAVERYGSEGALAARMAWTAFSTAFKQYPFSTQVLFFCPVQTGPANVLHSKKTGYSATMCTFAYDDLASWCEPYPAEVFASQFEKVATGWRLGIPLLKQAVEKAPPDRRGEAEDELRTAEAAHLHFQSVANQARFVLARNALVESSNGAPANRQHQLRTEIERCLQSEIDLAKRLFALTQEDSRIGFEAANQYFYLPLDLAEKVINCRWLLELLV
jgi:hypothetical protein